MEKKILFEIFRNIKKLMKKYEPPFKSTAFSDTRYELWSKKEVEIAGRKRREIYFAGLIIQGKYVGFYYMPIYAEPGLKKLLKPELLKLLKGKSCFHIKEQNEIIVKQIEDALKTGFNAYKKRGWI
jgi:hypothetical protein